MTETTDWVQFAQDYLSLLTAKEVAELTGLKPGTIHTYLSKGRMPKPVRYVFGHPLWSREEIVAWHKPLCQLCGQSFREHVIYHDEVPPGRQEAVFPGLVVHGMYCKEEADGPVQVGRRPADPEEGADPPSIP